MADSWTDQAERIVALEKQRNLPGALLAASELVKDLRRSDPRNELLPQAIDRKASIEEDVGEYREAERDYTEAIAMWRSTGNAQSARLATELNNLASLFSVMGQFKKAEPLRRESLDMRIQMLGPDAPVVAVSYSNLAVDLFRQQRYAESATLCHQALAIWSKKGPDDNQSDLAFNTLALIELKSERPSTALRFALAAASACGARCEANSFRRSGYKHTVALAEEASGKLDEAEKEFRGALSLLDRSGQKVPSLIHIGLLADYSRLLLQRKRTRESKRVLQTAEAEWNALVRTNQWGQTVDVRDLGPHGPVRK
jgi:tetratricopeptide (TPR) repeat protein